MLVSVRTMVDGSASRLPKFNRRDERERASAHGAPESHGAKGFVVLNALQSVSLGGAD